MTQAVTTPWRPNAVQEAVGLWAVGFLAIVAAFLLLGGTSVPKLVATVGFLYLPLIPMRWRDEDYADYGLSLRAWRQDLRLFLVLSAVVGPLFFLGFAGFVEVLPHLPPTLAKHLTPLMGEARFQPRLPRASVSGSSTSSSSSRSRRSSSTGATSRRGCATPGPRDASSWEDGWGPPSG